MVYSKANLEPARLAALDRETFVQFCPDGCSVGANKRGALVVGAVAAKLVAAVPVRSHGVTGQECTLTVDACKKVQATLPADKLFGGLLEHCNIMADGALGGSVNVHTTDGCREGRATFKDAGRRLPAAELKGQLRAVAAGGACVVLNGKRLEVLLQALRKACPDASGETPVWLWLDGAGRVVLGSVNYKTGQAAAGIMHAYSGAAAAVPPPLAQIVQAVPRASRVRRGVI